MRTAPAVSPKSAETAVTSARDADRLAAPAHPDVSPLLEKAVAELLQSTGQLLRRLRAESNTSELTWSQSAVMALLEKNGRSTISDLARAESVKPQSMSVTVAALERDGLVERSAHPTDGRQVLYGLTQKGLATRRGNSILKRQWLSSEMGRLSAAEQEAIIAAAALIKRLGAS